MTGTPRKEEVVEEELCAVGDAVVLGDPGS